MLTHDDYDSGSSFKEEYTLPKDVRSISIGYDGGRFYLSINDKTVYKTLDGTRDFSIEVDRD